MADQPSNEGPSKSNISGESSDATVELNIKTLDSHIYSFRVEKNVAIFFLSFFLSNRIQYCLKHFKLKANVQVFPFKKDFTPIYCSRLLRKFLTCLFFWIFQMRVSVFKEKIANEIGVPVNQQRLIFRGRVLKDEHLLSEYRIHFSTFTICIFVSFRFIACSITFTICIIACMFSVYCMQFYHSYYCM